MIYYAVAYGKINGIFYNWNDCNNSINGFKNAIYKKFNNVIDADNFIKENMISNNDIDYYVYTDGACSNNGKKNAKAGIGIFFGENDKRNVSKKIEGKQTNNTAELKAIIETFKIIEKDLNKGKKIAIVSDSDYAIKCATTYGEKCDKKNWEVDIPNKELVKELYKLYKDKNIKFIHINSHTNKTDVHSKGNHNADLLAVESIK